MEHIDIQMFGNFVLCTQSQKISDNENRARKVWL